jgi:hypothetical protein
MCEEFWTIADLEYYDAAVPEDRNDEQIQDVDQNSLELVSSGRSIKSENNYQASLELTDALQNVHLYRQQNFPAAFTEVARIGKLQIAVK